MWPFTSTYPEWSPDQVDGKAYDYVILGGGTAGCVLASLLSEDPDVSVLVVEKGHVKDNMVSRVPLMSQNFGMPGPLQIQDMRWTEPLSGANGRRTRLWAAEGLGGSSRINAMLWTRGPPGYYEAWAELGFKSWGWDHVEPYFKKIENAVAHPNSRSRGHQGLIELRQGKYPFKFAPYLEEAARRVGLPIVQDCNDPDAPAQGFYTLDMAINGRGERISAFTSFLSKDVALRRRDRLTVCTGAIASRLEIDAETGVVSGAHIRRSWKEGGGAEDREFFVKANREVIICSGAVCTPQLLLLSGIGPRAGASPGSSNGAPEDLGISLVKELPAVGATFADHYSFPVMLEVPRRETFSILQSAWALWYLLLWLLFGTGLMAHSSTLLTIFARTSAINRETMEISERDDEDGAVDTLDASQPRNVPDLEIMLMPVNSLQHDVPGRSLLSLFPTIVQPRATGRVELASRDPLAHPRVTHPALRDGADLAVARRAVRFSMRLAEEFQNSGYPYPAPLAFAPGNRPELLAEWERSAAEANPNFAAIPNQTAGIEGVEKVDVEVEVKSKDGVEEKEGKTWKNVTDEEIDDYVRRVAHSSLHYASSCPMSRDAATGVVDDQLRVHGFRNLRIADASVFPLTPSGHTMAPTMMVAARCADFVKDAWKGEAGSAQRKTK